MADVTFAILIIFLVVLAPLIIILYFLTKWKQTREISSGDELMLEELWELAQRMEERLESLEIILDTKAPDWRRSR